MNRAKLLGSITLGVALCGAPALAAETPAASGAPVNVEAKALKDADDIVFSAQQLQPIALESLPAPIDLSALGAADAPGLGVSATAKTLRDLDPSEIPGTARTLGGIARSGLPGAAGSRAAGAHSPSLPSAAQSRRRGSR